MYVHISAAKRQKAVIQISNLLQIVNDFLHLTSKKILLSRGFICPVCQLIVIECITKVPNNPSQWN